MTKIVRCASKSKLSSGMSLLLALIAGGLAQARTLHVSGYGTNTPPYANWADAATDIVWAVAAATNVGDEVWITNGTYSLTNTVIVTNGITLRGIGGYAILDGTGGLRCLLVSNAAAIAESLLLTNGNPATGYGAGVLMYRGLLTNCIITGCGRTNNPNTAGGGAALYNNSVLANCQVIGNAVALNGGGVYMKNTSEMRNCQISANTSITTTSAGGGGGLLLNDEACVINCTISGNFAGYFGGGIRALTGNWKIRNCLVAGNMCQTRCGGLNVGSSTSYTGVVQNCSVVGNIASIGNDPGGIYVQYGGVQFLNTISYSNLYGTTSGDFRHNAGVIVSVNKSCFGNTNGTYGDIYGAGNFTNNPLFVNAVGGDYRVRPDSPCINTGSNELWMAGAQDLDGHRRIDKFKGIVDIGAYEYLSKGTCITLR